MSGFADRFLTLVRFLSMVLLRNHAGGIGGRSSESNSVIIVIYLAMIKKKKILALNFAV